MIPYSNPAFGIDGEHAADQVPGAWRNICGHVEFSSLDFTKQLSDIFVVKGQVAGQECVEDNSTGPNVRR